MKQSAVGVVPARLESKRFPGKVLRTVSGKPLFVHAAERLSESGRVESVLVATDSEKVAAEAARFGIKAAMVTEPCACGSDRVARAVQDMEFGLAVNLQADQPLVDPADIDRVVEAMEGDDSLDIATLAYWDEDADVFAGADAVKVVTDARARALYFSRAPIPASKDRAGKTLFLHHVGIYCFRRDALRRFAALPPGRLEARESLEQLRALEAGMSIGVVVTDKAVPGVDRPSDIDSVERSLGG